MVKSNLCLNKYYENKTNSVRVCSNLATILRI